MLNILVAYPYLKKDVIKIIQENNHTIRFLLDSGAFTAWKSGKPIELDDYCKCIESLPFKPWRYFNLDVIGDGEASYKNYEIMLKRGLNPVPIFTRGEDIKVLEEYYKTSDVVGIGGLVGTKGNKGFVKGIMKVVGDRKVHWLGFNPQNFLAHYKPYMCDSSSWCSAVRFASCKLYDKNGIWYGVNKRDFIIKPNRKILNIIKGYGMNPQLLADEGQWKNSGTGKYALELLTCRSWTKYQIDVKKKLNINFFLACACGWQVKLMLDSYKFWKEKGL